MDIEKIEKFIDAGYTKAEIDAMLGAAPKSEEAGADTPDAGEEQGNASAENAREINQPVEIGAAIEALTNTVKGLQETVKAMQEKNIAGASTDKPKKDTIKETIDSFMQNF